MTTLHLIALPHTEIMSLYSTCAYTMKLLKLGKMLTGRPRRVVLYGGHLNEAPCDEHVELVSTEERERWFGPWDPNDAFSKITWNPADEPWAVMNARAITEIRTRAHPKDLILITAGLAQKPIADAFPAMIACEWAVGYEGVFAKYRAFESYAWMHYLYGKYGTADGRYYDRVIPNFFDPDDFHLEPKEDYLLFIGRLIARKGPHVAAQIAEACGRRLLVAGPGASSVTPLPGGGCRIVGNGVTLEGPHIEYVGAVDPITRASLMAKAAAVLVPTQYIGPFEGVAVEAMLSGTPAVTSDWGAFGETVDEGVTGYRFRTLAQGVEAVARCQGLDPRKIRARAVSRYSLEAVAPQFEAWFDQLDGLWGEGWNALPAKALPLVYEGA